MPILRNTKHEIFAIGIAQGLSQYRAYKEAGFKVSTYHSGASSASSLIKKPDIAARVEELRGQFADRAIISANSATVDLMRLARKGEDLNDAAGMAVARAALMDACKINGFILDRSAVKFDFDFSKCTDEELPVAVKMFARMAAEKMQAPAEDAP